MPAGRDRSAAARSLAAFPVGRVWRGCAGRPRFGTLHALAIHLATLLALISPGAISAAHAESNREAMLKAAIVFKLTRYVAWPDAAFDDDPASLRICLAGDPGVLDAMSEVEGREVDGRKVAVISLAASESVSECNMLYIGKGEAARVVELASVLRENSVVSVSELPSFANEAE